MKYLGEKSLSSVLSVILNIAWYVVLVGAAIGGVFLVGLMIFPQESWAEAMELVGDPDWEKMSNLPLVVRLLFAPYYVVVVLLLLKIIHKCRQVFRNFTDDVVFRSENVDLIREIGKILIVFSIITFQLGALIGSLLLLLLCEVFKNGARLQEEHDLTV